MRTRVRRRYRMGRPCQDCGRRYKPTTVVVFWSTGMRYAVCGECISAYRRIILGPAHTHTQEAAR